MTEVLEEPRYGLTLFVNGASDLSVRAIADATQLCENHLAGSYHLTVVDLFQDPDAGIGSGVQAAPTLVKNRPLPERKLVGDLSHQGRVLLALAIPAGGVAVSVRTESP
jgi:circadian clock protein KaiB